MSKYTTELRYICEYEAGLDESEGYNSIDDILTASAPNIFSFDFPIFDETYRPVLEKAILRHFYTREISEETYGLWKLRLEDKMNLIMPYYNRLYETELLEFNPLYDVDLTTTHEGQFDGTTNANNSNTRTLNTQRSISGTEDTDRTINQNESGTNGNTRTLNTTDSDSGSDIKKNTRWDLFSDTPQGGLDGINGDNDSVANNTYLTNARKIIDDGTGSTFNNTKTNTGTITDAGTSSKSGTSVEDTGVVKSETIGDTGTIGDSGTARSVVNNLDEYTERVVGKRGNISYAKMIMEFRDSFIRIEEKIMKELEPLFFGLW